MNLPVRVTFHLIVNHLTDSLGQTLNDHMILRVTKNIHSEGDRLTGIIILKVQIDISILKVLIDTIIPKVREMLLS